MSESPCSRADCPSGSAPGTASCRYCRLSFCAQHKTVEGGHDCSTLDDSARRLRRTAAINAELAQLKAILQQSDITSLAKRLRPGHELLRPILFDPEDRSLRGTVNAHIPVDFDDGERWLVRARQLRGSLGRAHTREVMQMGIYTLRWLKEIGMPVPEVMSDLQTEGGTDFFLMKRIPGDPGLLPISKETNREKVSRTVADFANILVRISKHPFDKIGAIVPSASKGTWTVGPLLGSDGGKTGRYTGPFNTAAERWNSHFDSTIDAIRNHGAYGSKREAAFLTFSWFRDVVAGYEPFNRVERTYLMHVDAGGDHFMLGENGQINGIIDWDQARTAPAIEAFAAPVALMDVQGYLGTGHNELSPEEVELIHNLDQLGRSDLSEYVRGGRVYQRLALTVGLGGLWANWKMVQGVAEALGVRVPETRDEFLEEQRVARAAELQTLDLTSGEPVQ